MSAGKARRRLVAVPDKPNQSANERGSACNRMNPGVRERSSNLVCRTPGPSAVALRPTPRRIVQLAQSEKE